MRCDCYYGNLSDMHRNLPFKPILLAFCFLLSACGHPPEGPYAEWLETDEMVDSVSQEGPFTILHIEYVPTDWLRIFSSQNRFDRVLYKGKVVLDKGEPAQLWQGLGQPVVIAHQYADISDDQSPLFLIYERNNKAVVEHIDMGIPVKWIGEPIGPGLRYFKDEDRKYQGSILKAFPVEKTNLPKGPAWPSINSLAGFTPDMKAFAYVDSLSEPSVVIVVDAKGHIGEPIPLPARPRVPEEVQTSEYLGKLYPWFDAQFKWQVTPTGKWDLARTAPMENDRSATSALEELFLDAGEGYRNCFGSTSIACLDGWRRDPEGEAYEHCKCAGAHVYRPVQPVQAFGWPVNRLLYATSGNGSAYHLVLDAPPEKVVGEIRKRLRARRLKVADTGENAHESVDANQFVTPTVTVRVEAFEQGSLIRTIARYPANQ